MKRKYKIQIITLISIVIIVFIIFRIISIIKSINVIEENKSNVDQVDLSNIDDSNKTDIDYSTYDNVHGVSTHFGLRYSADSIEQTHLLKELGITTVRDDIRWELIEKNGVYDFSKTDKWINKLTQEGIDIIAVLGFATKDQIGSDYKISNQEDLDNYLEMLEKVATQYPQITKYELLNEPNYTYKTEEDISWAAKVEVEGEKLLKKINPNIEVFGEGVGAIGNPSVGVLLKDYYQGLVNANKEYNKKNLFTFHVYDWDYQTNLNNGYKGISNSVLKMLNDNGGFTRTNINEFGINSTRRTEQEQANQLVQQSIIADKNNIKTSIIYNFKELGNDKTNTENTFGIVDYNYQPKPAYNALKYYYDKIKGTEYIGPVELLTGVETHLYLKNGKPFMVSWSKNTKNEYTFNCEGTSVTDIYGNEVQKEDEKIKITSSPVYIEGVSEKYVYQAISNRMKERWTAFQSKDYFKKIVSSANIQEEIDKSKEFITKILEDQNKKVIQESIIKQSMIEFYQIGNKIIECYKNGTLQVELVNLSSMLDALNDIGDSYEDLFTLVAETNNNPTVESTGSKLEEAKEKIQNNIDLDEVIYPNKILQYSEEFYKKATYLNAIERKTKAQTSLTISKNLHAELLADWAKQFAEVGIEQYLQNNPTKEVTYTTEDGQEYQLDKLTNQTVIATLPKTEDMNITSEGGNTHTFENNDSFTFTYTRRGREFEAVATVNNIDKDAPLITGAEDGKRYINAVIKLEVQDVNLDKIELYKNEEKVADYTKSEDIQQISENGTYKVVVFDKAGNNTTIQFEIVDKKTEYINRVNELVEQYSNFENKYTTQINVISGLSSFIDNIKQELQKIIENTNSSNVIEQLENTYKLGNSFIDNISNTNEVINVLKDIEVIGKKYSGLIELSEEKTDVNVGNIETQMVTVTNNLNNNTDLDIQALVELKDIAVGYYNSINESSDYMKKYNLISTQYINTYIEKILSGIVNKYVNSNPIGDITYSTTADKITNKNVIATLPIKDNMQILSSGGNTHTFTKNGEFKFKYNRRGNEYEAIARVANIDKTPPVIKGIANNRTYTSAISPKVQDAHLNENNIKLYFNNNLKTNYKNGDTISEVGKYKMVAIDQVGNRTEVNFEIKDKIKPNDTNKELETNVYDIQGSIIKKVTSSTTYEKFRENIQTGLEYEIKRDGDLLAEEDEIATGDILTVNNTNKQYTLIVTGDISSDGRVNSIDLVRIRRFLLNTKQLDNIEKLAADANLDGNNVDISDMVRIRKIILQDNR